MKQDNILNLVSRIYDTALDPDSWPDVLMEIAESLGASGSMIFEMTETDGFQRIRTPYQSKNYDQAAVQAYLQKHNAQELIDQAAFAEISGSGPDINLVDDIQFNLPREELLNQSNVVDMMAAGLKHRSGTVLNKDSWQIDRFSLQYSAKRGPSNADEKKLAALILPHVAKALRIGRPLMGHAGIQATFSARMDKLPFGLCVISPKGFPIATNLEFDRITAETNVFKYQTSGQLIMSDGKGVESFKSLIADNDIHGKAGAFPRRQSIFLPNENEELGYFIEICPIAANSEFGKLPTNSRLITILDSQKSRQLGSATMARFFPLSKSEQAVLELIGLGHTNKEIADIRNRAEETINSQVKSLLFKTYTKNRTELVQLALSIEAPFTGNMTGFTID